MDSLTTWVRYTLLTGIFAVPFIPFLISGSMFFPFITLKNFAFRILVELLLGLYVILALRAPEYRPRKSWILWILGAFVLSVGVATVLSVDPSKSFWSNFERMEGYIGLLHLAAYFLVAGAVLSTVKLWERFVQTSVGASVLMGGYGLFQLSGFLVINQGGLRVDGTFGNAIYLAAYMLFHIFLTLWLYVRHRGSVWVRVAYIAIMALQFLMLLYSGTRGALLGLAVGLFIAAGLIAWREREQKHLRQAAILLLGLMVLAGGVFFGMRNIPAIAEHPILSRFAKISFSERTIEARFMVWGIALEGVAEKPVFGWGQENFNYVFNTYYDPQMYAQEQWFDRAHNSFLDWLIAGGAVSFLLFLSLFVLLALGFLRADSKLSFSERAVLFSLVLGYGIHSLFVFDNLTSSIYFFSLLAFAHMLTRAELPASPAYLKPLPQNLMTPALIIVVVATLGASYYLNAAGIASAKGLLAAITPTAQGVGADGTSVLVPKDPRTNLAQFKETYERAYLGRQETLEQLLQTAANLAGTENADPKLKQDFFDLAYEKGKEFMEARAGDARLELFFGAFLSQSGRRDEALTYLMLAHEHSPRKQGILLETAINGYLNAGDTAGALPLLKEAFDLAPAFDEARILYTVGLLHAGKQADADALLVERYGTVHVSDSRILKTYFDLRYFDRVIAIWEGRVAANPTDLQTRVSLAAAHLAAGDRGGAIQVLRDAIAIEPSFKAQGEQFIADIQAGRLP